VPSSLAVVTRGLTHRYRGGEAAVRAVALAVPQGSIYGFLGPNGAGKTTTLRLLLGLLRIQEGEIGVLGRPMPRERATILRQVGSSVETPSLYGDLTARENLEVWRLLFDLPQGRVEDALRLVGLAGTGSKRARAFSMGMKQRLALAVALLHTPRLLVLDEPANGLDPQGILEMRDLLQRLNRERGITILLSSHVLSEVARLVTDVGVIRRGELRFQGTLRSLLERHRGREVVLRAGDPGRAAALIAGARLERGKLVVPSRSDAETAEIVRRLVREGVDVHEVTPLAADLEQVFLDLVEERP
jgi:ABC-type multidrug transport system ATPase subunit